MSKHEALSIYVSKRNEDILEEVRRLKDERISLAQIFFDGLRLWLEENREYQDG